MLQKICTVEKNNTLDHKTQIQQFWNTNKTISKSFLHEKSIRDLQLLCEHLQLASDGRKITLENRLMKWMNQK